MIKRSPSVSVPPKKKGQIKTNADRIRNMSDEELAEYLKIVQEHTIKSQQVDNKEDMLNFLKSEVKEGESDAVG